MLDLDALKKEKKNIKVGLKNDLQSFNQITLIFKRYLILNNTFRNIFLFN